MPYIHCEVCGSGCYSNVLSCPVCKAPVRHDRSGGLIPRRRAHPPQMPADLEDEVRSVLYGQRTGCVSPRAAASAPPPRLA